MRETTPAAIAIVGAGAAGLMAGIWAARGCPGRRVVLLDGAHHLGAKILISGGGRCNVTHHKVDAARFAGSTPAAIRKVLRRFDVRETVEMFRQAGVNLVREESGKLFPDSGRARTVLEALLRTLESAGAEVLNPRRVASIERDTDGFRLSGTWGTILAERVILATGGQALPRSGSDGQGYEFAREFGHTLTPQILPALVPLKLAEGHFLTRLSGTTLPARLTVLSSSGKRLDQACGSLLCAHFGISGPVTLDISRYLLSARAEDSRTRLVASCLPDQTRDSVARSLDAEGNQSLLRWLRSQLPDRLATALMAQVPLQSKTAWSQTPRPQRRKLLELLTELELPVTGHRGFAKAEVTAGGVPLSEIRLESMESRCAPGLHLCGEICDVDGPIGGFNFQWAWASARVAGEAAAEGLSEGCGA